MEVEDGISIPFDGWLRVEAWMHQTRIKNIVYIGLFNTNNTIFVLHPRKELGRMGRRA